ncbi:MAG: peptidylprolyl isomerase [Candidatus Pacearchaeota archaeon]
MADVIKKGDFIELDFTGMVKGGAVFDSTIKEELEKLHSGHNHEIVAKPFVFCVGEGMFLSSIEEFLVGKNFGEEYIVELPPNKAFGERNLSLIQKIPLEVFHKQKVEPMPGVTFSFDGYVGRVLAISGGRVIVDFNNPLAGKYVQYKLKILRKIEDIAEKIRALNEFYFKKNLEFEISEGEKKIILKVEKQFVEITNLLKERFERILNFNIEIKDIDENNQYNNPYK